MTKRIVLLMLCVLMTISMAGCAQKELTVTGPENATVAFGESGTFTVTASGGKEPYTYEWYVYNPDESSWLLIAGSEIEYVFTGFDTPTLTTCAENETDPQFYCKVTDAEGTSVDSAVATLTVTVPMAITSHPHNVTVTYEKEPATATFEVAVTGGMAP